MCAYSVTIRTDQFTFGNLFKEARPGEESTFRNTLVFIIGIYMIEIHDTGRESSFAIRTGGHLETIDKFSIFAFSFKGLLSVL